ncbi:MAG: GAF domain-containing protein [Gaiellales bacterium]
MLENGSRVLVVDGDRFYREAIDEVLCAAGIACESVADADAALEAASERDFGAVVLDLGPPDSNGIELLKRLRAAGDSLRVIVLSVPADHEAVLAALRLDAVDYLAKPLHAEELVLAVQRALRGHSLESRWSALCDRIRGLEARVSGLWDSARAASPERRVEALAVEIAEAVSLVLGAGKASLMVMADDGTLRVAASVGHGLPPDEMDPVAPGESVAGRVYCDSEPVVIDDIRTDDRFAAGLRSDRYRSNSLAVTPVSAGGPPIGVLCATDREDGGAFGAEDLALLRILALQVGQILAVPPAASEEGGAVHEGAVAPVLPEAIGETDASELARRVCDAMTMEVEPERLVAAALHAIARTLPAEPVGLFLIDNASGSVVLEGQVAGAGPAEREGFERNAGLTGLVLQTGRLVATDHPDKDPRFEAAVDTPANGAIRPFVCVPIQIRGKTLGVLRAFPTEGQSASAQTAEVLSAAMSAAVRNVLLYRSLLESIDEVARARRESRSGRGRA